MCCFSLDSTIGYHTKCIAYEGECQRWYPQQDSSMKCSARGSRVPFFFSKQHPRLSHVLLSLEDETLPYNCSISSWSHDGKIFLSFLEANIFHGNQKQDHNSNANKLTIETLHSRKLGRVPWSYKRSKGSSVIHGEGGGCSDLLLTLPFRSSMDPHNSSSRRVYTLQVQAQPIQNQRILFLLKYLNCKHLAQVLTLNLHELSSMDFTT